MASSPQQRQRRPTAAPRLECGNKDFCKWYSISKGDYADWVSAWRQTLQGQLWGIEQPAISK